MPPASRARSTARLTTRSLTAGRSATVIRVDDTEYARAEARTTIERLTSILDPRARDVLRMRFQHDLRQWQIAAAIGCSQMQVSPLLTTSLERLSAHASMACGGWSMSDTTEGATA